MTVLQGVLTSAGLGLVAVLMGRVYTAAAFVGKQGPGNSFLFRANVDRHRENKKWEDSWKNRFVPVNERIKREDFIRFYKDMMSSAVRDLGIVSEV